MLQPKVLIVVAHPDDEVLGAGGTAATLVDSGARVRTCILSGNAAARAKRPGLAELQADTLAAHELLGLPPPVLGDFPNVEFNTVPHLQLVRFIEQAIREAQADVIFTHHPGDLNNDHVHTSLACQAACRLFQRGTPVPSLRGLYYCEVLSSTDWAFNAGAASCFVPNAFFEIGEAGLERKLKALRAYRGVQRAYPHSRSIEAVKGLAAIRGAQAGRRYAEGFQTAFLSLDFLRA